MDSELRKVLQRLSSECGRELGPNDVLAGVQVHSKKPLTQAQMSMISDDGYVGYEFGTSVVPDIVTWTLHIAAAIDEMLMNLNRHGPIRDVRLLVEEHPQAFAFRVSACVLPQDQLQSEGQLLKPQ